MIVKNEEDLLGKFLINVNKFVDEIIIVDTGSKDRTKEIAKKFTNKVYDYKWNDDFSAARNFSIRKATKDWILVLDVDEVISKNDLIKIKKIINNKFIGYSFLQKTYMREEFPFKFVKINNKKYKGYTFRRITRLFKNNKKIRFEYPVHETVVNSIKKIGKIKSFDIDINHYQKNINKKNSLYIKLLKKKIKEWPEAKFYCELGMEYLLVKNKKDAERYFRKASKLNNYYKRFLADI